MNLWIIVLAAWACGIAIMDPPGCMCSQLHAPINVVNFTTQGASKVSYMRFMTTLHDKLTKHASKGLDIPVLPDPLPDNDSNQYLYVGLSNGPQTITIALNVSDVSMVGYLAPNSKSWFFSDVSEGTLSVVFPHTEQNYLPFTNQYEDLEIAAQSNRLQIPLGILELGQHIGDLYTIDPQAAPEPIARAIIVCLQMVSEAARLRKMLGQVLAFTPDSAGGQPGVFYPDDLLIAFEDNWRKLSAEVQSAQDGIFEHPVLLVNKGPRSNVTTVREVVFMLALMPPVTSIVHTKANLRFSPRSAMHVRSMMADYVSQRFSGGFDPTVHIMGQDNYCVDVADGIYTDGNRIIIWPCGPQKNQLWTFKSDDSTIRSGGKCLTASASSPGSSVVIYNCSKVFREAIEWIVLSNGTIKNPASELVLTADGYDKNVTITSNNANSTQAWYATKTLKPFVTSIVGFDAYCLEAYETSVRLDDCQTLNPAQNWILYADGTIRPQITPSLCLVFKFERTTVYLEHCYGSPNERWLFQSEGTILHMGSQLVMDVMKKGMYPEVTVNPDQHRVQFNQIWFQVP